MAASGPLFDEFLGDLYPSNLFKLFQVHLSIAVQVEHLKGNLKVPLGS